MILTTILVSGIMVSASAIAGLLMFYQLRQSNDAYASNIAMFAADAGLEASLSCYYNTPGFPSVNDTCYEVSGGLPNGGTYEAELDCKKEVGGEFESVDCRSGESVGFSIVSRGFGPKTERLLQSFFSIRK